MISLERLVMQQIHQNSHKWTYFTIWFHQCVHIQVIRLSKYIQMEYPTRSDFHSICSDLLNHSPTYTYTVKVIIQTSCFKQYNNSFSVRICNTTSEICEGEGQICTGIDRGKRSLDYSNDFSNSSDSINGTILPFMSDSERDRRSPGDYIPLHEDTQQFISRGPILAYIKDDTGQGEFTVNSIFLDIGTIFISIFMNMNIFM